MTQKASKMTQEVAKMTRLKEPKVGEFAMVSDEALAAMDMLIKDQPQAARLLTKLVRYLPMGTGGVVVMSRQTICELMDCSLSSAARAIKVLKKGGWVQTVRVSGAYGFAINARVAWRGSRSGIQHAVFYATVVTSSSEQDPDYEDDVPMRHVPITSRHDSVVVSAPLAAPPAQQRIEGIEPVLEEHVDESTGEISWKKP